MATDLIDLLGSLFMITWISLTNLDYFSYQNNKTEAYDLPYLRNHHWTNLTLLEFSTLSSDRQMVDIPLNQTNHQIVSQTL